MSVQSLAIQPPVQDSAVTSRRLLSSSCSPTSRARADNTLSEGTVTRWLARAGQHAERRHARLFRSLQLPHVQLDELRARLRSRRVCPIGQFPGMDAA